MFSISAVTTKEPFCDPQQIININMQRKKSDIVDYKFSSSPQNYNQLFNHHPANDSHIQQNHQNFFMKYASSIIQVVNEQKLQKSNKYGAQGDPKSPIYEISEVNYYQAETSVKSSEDKPVISNNYNTLGQGFKKKTNKKHILTYNFTNITLFSNHISKIQGRILKNAFSCLKNVPKKIKTVNNQPPKSKSSFHSDYTVSTNNEENGPRKFNSLHLQLKRNPEFKQGINTIKGWLQFRLLIIKSQAFRSIQTFFRSKQSGHKQSKLKCSLGFNLYFHNDESFSLVNQEEQSLAYTADQNFQFSQKQITVSSPQKTSIQLKFNGLNLNKDSRIAISRYGTPNTHQSVVEVYKLNRAQPSKLLQNANVKVSQAKPICLHLLRERKHLILRTNIFQLPLISEFYLKDEQMPQLNQFALNKDILIQNRNQTADQSQQIIQQFQACKSYFNSKISLKRSQLKSKINNFQNKSSKLIFQSSKDVRTHIVTQRNSQKSQINRPTVISPYQQKKGPHKVEDYYFPGLQSKMNRMVQSKSRIKIQGDNKNCYQSEKIELPISHQKQSNPFSKNIRIQQSLVGDLPFQNQSRVSRVADIQKNQMITSKQKKVTFNLATQTKLQHNKPRPKVNVAFNSPQQRISTSPQNVNPHSIGSNEIKRKPYFSPPSTLRHFDIHESSKNNLVSKPNVQQEYNQMRPTQQPLRYSNKTKQIQQVQNNIYQLNFPNHQPKTLINNVANYYHKVDNKIPNSKPIKQINQHVNYKMVQQNVLNRPGSRMALSPPSTYLNIPMKAQNLPYGIATSRQNSQKKVSFYSPQTHRKNHPQITFHQQPKAPQKIVSPHRLDYNQQYFLRQNHVNKPEEKAINFHNRYYTIGNNIPLRPHQMIAPNFAPPQAESNPRRKFGSQRPHSSFRQTNERFNIFSNHSPLESQIQHIQRSNNFTSRNSSQISRPKSMNEKILVTMRRER